MIIDFHTHCFPDKLAPRALSALKINADKTGLAPCTDGTRVGTEQNLIRVGIDRAVVCNIATNAKQQANVNGFAIELTQSSRLIPLGSLHPDGEQKRETLLKLRSAGIGGIKIHPDYVTTEIDNAKFDEIFSLCEDLEMFVVTHAGWDPVSPEHIYATPEAIRTVIDRYPHLKLVAAHMGGFACADGVIEHLVGRNIYIDTSLSSHRSEEKDKLHRILRDHDPDKILFATDTPWSDAREELEFIYSAKLSDKNTQKILYQNALALLGLRQA